VTCDLEVRTRPEFVRVYFLYLRLCVTTKQKVDTHFYQMHHMHVFKSEKKTSFAHTRSAWDNTTLLHMSMLVNIRYGYCLIFIGLDKTRNHMHTVAVAPDCTLPASASSESSRSLGGDGRRAWSPFLRFLIGDHGVRGPCRGILYFMPLSESKSTRTVVSNAVGICAMSMMRQLV